ncbi:MAG: hypothetical protein H6709_13540 [Kofleriaceae bacterium]|nr:hypothetical protein [Myxococcales bacterium]MCB9561932.1 hypothetical protein [Kofleriaceae bacterium]MCB9573101.1 hypothetical protein [Kofleriaceae bacterium]
MSISKLARLGVVMVVVVVGAGVAVAKGAKKRKVAPSFARVTGWSTLRPGMAADDARAALTARGVAVEEHAGNAKPPHWLAFERDGWRGTIYLDDGDRRVSEILFQGPKLDDEAATDAVVAGYRARYGAAATIERVDGADGTFVETHHTWRNAHVVLVVTAHGSQTGGWWVSEVWRTPTAAQP